MSDCSGAGNCIDAKIHERCGPGAGDDLLCTVNRVTESRPLREKALSSSLEILVGNECDLNRTIRVTQFQKILPEVF